MRISDWSSDVCSSDRPRSSAQRWRNGKRPRVDVGRSRSSRAKSRDGSKHVSTSLDTNGYGIIMCGIIGILGKDEVTARLVERLRRLASRRYDSAGGQTLVAAHSGGRRAKGKLDN